MNMNLCESTCLASSLRHQSSGCSTEQITQIKARSGVWASRRTTAVELNKHPLQAPSSRTCATPAWKEMMGTVCSDPMLCPVGKRHTCNIREEERLCPDFPEPVSVVPPSPHPTSTPAGIRGKGWRRMEGKLSQCNRRLKTHKRG